LNRCLTRARCDHHMKTGATVAAFARPVRLRPVDRRSTPCPRASPIAPRTSSLAVQTQRRKLRRTRPERSAWPEPELTSSGSWQPREPMLPDDRDFGRALARFPSGSASSWMVFRGPRLAGQDGAGRTGGGALPAGPHPSRRHLSAKFLAAPRLSPSRQLAGAQRENDRRAIRRGRAGRPRDLGGCTAARLLS
jgi:hypothetical protein